MYGPVTLDGAISREAHLPKLVAVTLACRWLAPLSPLGHKRNGARRGLKEPLRGPTFWLVASLLAGRSAYPHALPASRVLPSVAWLRHGLRPPLTRGP